MSSIDNRIVNMQFNNKGFESGVATTLNSLKKLNESLKMKNTSKGLSDITDNLQKVNNTGITSLSRGLDVISSRFSTLGVIGTTALINITNRAVNAGTSITKALTLEPVMSGFSEYETKMGSIQTILTNTAHAGTTLKDVTKTLDELNKYADLTIYNFEEMTRNIGTFTAAGVDLDTSAAAIKGIANLAAASGSTSAQASTAMYQLSQALAAGRVSLQDWNSVVNAGMGGKLFQDSLIRTSEVLGTNAEAMIEKYGSFRESLTKGEWLTSEVLTETLKQLSGAYTEADLIAKGFSESQAKEIVQLAKNATAAATEVKTVTQLFDTMKESVQSGWAQSWEYIIGDKDQATATLTAISDAFNNIIQPSTDARNSMLKTWNELGGRESLIIGLSNIFQSLGKILSSVRDAFTEVFPPMTGWNLTLLTKGFQDFTEKIKINDKTARKIKDTFQGLFSILSIATDGVKTLATAFMSGGSILGKVGEVVLNTTSSMGRFFTNIYESLHASRIFENAANSIKKGIDSIGKFFNSCIETIGIFVGSLSKLDFKPIIDTLSTIGAGLGKGLEDVFEGVGKAIGNINLNNLITGLGLLASKDMFKTIKDSILGFKDSLEELSGIGDNISGVLSGVKDALEAYQQDLSAGTLLKIAAAISLLAGSILLLASIKPNDMENALIGLTTLMVELIAGFAVLLGIISAKNIKGIFTVTSALLMLSIALTVMSTAMKNMSKLSWDEIARGLVGVAGSMLILVAASKLLNTNAKGMLGTAAALVVLGGALVVMSEAVKRFGALDFKSMLQGLLGVGLILTELGLFMKLTSVNKMGLVSSAGILLLASSMLIFQNAVAKFGEMDIPNLVKGITSLGAILLELSVFSKLVSGASGILTTSAAMVVIAGAINLLVPAIRSLGDLSWEEIAKGLTSLAGAFTILGVASNLISGVKLASIGVGLGVMSASMLLLSTSLKSMGSMSWEEIAKGLVTLSGSLVIFAAAMAGMSGGLVGASAMLVMSAAMALFTPQLIAMANLSWGQIAAGLTMLAGAFVVIGVAGLALTPIVPGLIGLAGAITLLGVACLAAGTGVALFATGMATLAAVGAGGGLALAEILRQLISLLPKFAKALGDSLVEFAKAIGNGMPELAKAMGKCMIGILEAIEESIPKIIEVGIKFITNLLDVITENLPRFIDSGVNMILAIIEGLIRNIGKIVEAAVDLVIAMLNALQSKIGEIIQAGIDLGIALVEGLADGITNNKDRAKQAMDKLGQAVIDAFMTMLGIDSSSKVFKDLGIGTIAGLISGIGSKKGEVKTNVTTLGSDMITAIKTRVPEFLTSGATLITNMAQGVKSKINDVINNVKTIVTTAVTSVKSKASEFLTSGASLITNLASGIKNKAKEVSTSITSAINNAKSAASSAASNFRSIGINMVQGLINGIKSMASSVSSTIRNVVNNAVKAAKNALGIHSPSRVFMSIGDFTVQGFVKGINDNVKMVDDTSINLAKRAIDGVSNTISTIGKSLDGEIDTSIVVTPVMDISNIESGARMIRDIMSDNNRFAINAETTGDISRTIGQIQNGNNDDRIIQALKDLKTSVSSMNRPTYNINGITYDDGSNVSSAIETLIRAARIERRI